ncbi:hypothetical protein AB3459_31920, partial [Pseudomonas aeruginosa]
MNPQKHSASVAEEQMLAHFRAHAPQQPAPALDQAILAAARRLLALSFELTELDAELNYKRNNVHEFLNNP